MTLPTICDPRQVPNVRMLILASQRGNDLPSRLGSLWSVLPQVLLFDIPSGDPGPVLDVIKVLHDSEELQSGLVAIADSKDMLNKMTPEPLLSTRCCLSGRLRVGATGKWTRATTGTWPSSRASSSVKFS